MLRFLLSRVIQGIAVIFSVLCITFIMVKLKPGDPLESERHVQEHILKQRKALLGLDKPWPVQLGRHIANFATFDFPPMLKLPGRGVDEVIIQAFPVSAQVGLAALAIALTIGIPVGALAALRPHSLEDRASMIMATFGVCTPSLVLGPLIALVFGLKLRWFNASGWFDADDWVLPAVTLGIIYSAYIARLTRGGLRETLAQEFIRTARAKGASESAVVFRHAFKLACLPVLNFLGPTAAGLMTGSIVTENVFQLPGLGQHFVAAAQNGNDELTMATAAFYALMIVTFNLLVDVVQALLNPRISLRE
ncbi:ABC transporter permease [Brevifollis gellanilyticus]|uniref:ABC transporter n=1 Tax=Brevifollis gellanilyticus TaxID=748831 RepID=A0A512MAP8_9BACT|nr:ABC transporter permease [Brevifollis gellanilyticus]GEP43815.1 ABC transporter [Brevifollis gellanilyticus]